LKFDRAPRIETDRLLLRAHRVEDLPACAAMWRDEVVVRFIGGRPFTREEVWARMLRYTGMWVVMGHGFWAIEEKAGGALVGEVGVMEARRDIAPSFEGEPEIGWALVPEAHGRGYATEAVAAALAWADANVDAPKLVCIIGPGNAASIRVAEKFGFRERLRTTYHGAETIQFERPRLAGMKSNG
jgi:RimJ/RimL family protein N-acetyltransferase